MKNNINIYKYRNRLVIGLCVEVDFVENGFKLIDYGCINEVFKNNDGVVSGIEVNYRLAHAVDYFLDEESNKSYYKGKQREYNDYIDYLKTVRITSKCFINSIREKKLKRIFKKAA